MGISMSLLLAVWHLLPWCIVLIAIGGKHEPIGALGRRSRNTCRSHWSWRVGVAGRMKCRKVSFSPSCDLEALDGCGVPLSSSPGRSPTFET